MYINNTCRLSYTTYHKLSCDSELKNSQSQGVAENYLKLRNQNITPPKPSRQKRASGSSRCP